MATLKSSCYSETFMSVHRWIIPTAGGSGSGLYLGSGEDLWVGRDPGQDFTQNDAEGENIHLKQAAD